ncbi:hypothetical protein C8J57DRAFT_1235695 [Mycena rebaudengoi]|nr:hypothetical protein C8J57DRAFT_1235695 [Mycena rebaudengoi]
MTEGLNQDSKSPANIKSLSQEVHQSGKLGELGHLVNCRLTVSALSIIHVWSCHITIGRAGRAGPPTSSRRCAVPRHGATCARRAPASGARGGLGGGFGACHPARPRALRGMRDSTRWSTSAVWAHPAQDVLDRAGTSKQGGTGGGRRQSSYLAVDLPQPNMANADVSSSPVHRLVKPVNVGLGDKTAGRGGNIRIRKQNKQEQHRSKYKQEDHPANGLGAPVAVFGDGDFPCQSRGVAIIAVRAVRVVVAIIEAPLIHIHI